MVLERGFRVMVLERGFKVMVLEIGLRFSRAARAKGFLYSQVELEIWRPHQ